MNAAETAKIDGYLFGEMNEADRDKFDQEMMTDDELFYDVAERENELVDRYLRGDLEDSLAESFRNSLAKFPARRDKLSNASVLKAHIEEGRSAAAEAASIPWYRRLGFAFRAPALAAAAMALLLVGTVGFLLVQNQNLNQQVAALNSNGQNLSQLREREAELQAMIEAERDAGSDLTTDLESERERRAALEAELSELRKQINSNKPLNESQIVPTIATLILRPTGIRGGPENVRRLRLDDEKRVALKIVLPAERSEGTFSVKVNDIPSATSIKPIREPSGSSSITATVASSFFRNGLNRVEVFDSNSQNVVSFAVVCERGPVR